MEDGAVQCWVVAGVQEVVKIASQTRDAMVVGGTAKNPKAKEQIGAGQQVETT